MGRKWRTLDPGFQSSAITPMRTVSRLRPGPQSPITAGFSRKAPERLQTIQPTVSNSFRIGVITPLTDDPQVATGAQATQRGDAGVGQRGRSPGSRLDLVIAALVTAVFRLADRLGLRAAKSVARVAALPCCGDLSPSNRHRHHRHDGRDRALVDKLRMVVAAKHHREPVEPVNDPLQLDPVHQEDCKGLLRSRR